MAESELWQRLLRDALTVLALPPDEQARVNGPGPGCVACDLLNDFDHARKAALDIAAAILTDEQRRLLDRIETIMQTMQKPDFECFNNDVVRRPVWQELREVAAESLRTFGWGTAGVSPYMEVEPGVWRRPPNDT